MESDAPQNFLSTVLVPVAVPDCVAAEFRREGDHLGAEAGEVLVAPFGGGQGDACGRRSMHGVLTLGCSSIARVVEMPAGEAFAAYADSPWARAFELDQDVVIALVIQQSSRLLDLQGAHSFVRVEWSPSGPVFFSACAQSRRARESASR